MDYKKGVPITIDRQAPPLHGFEPGIKWSGRSRLGPVDWVCIAIFWGCLLWQLITGFIILGSTNYNVSTPENGVTDICPHDYLYAPTQCQALPSWDNYACVEDDLCNQLTQCIDSLPKKPKHHGLLNRNLKPVPDEEVLPSFWPLLGKYWYVPTVICLGVVILAVAWLYALQLLVKPIIWGTLFLGVVLLVGFWAFWFVEYEVNNWMLLVGAGIELIFMALCWRSINRSADVISIASEGLRCSPTVIGVSILVEALYIGYIALWITFIIASFNVKEVDPNTCHLVEPEWIVVSRWIYGPMFFIFTYVFLNIKTVVCAAGIGAWYFPDPNAPIIPALKGLRWALTSSSGAIMFASLFVGIVRYIVNRISDTMNWLPICLSPLACLWRCIAGCILGVLEMFSKFMLIGQTFCGEAFCGSAKRSFSVVKDRLGDAFITDSIGGNVVTMSTYIFSLGLGIASWAWLDSAQDSQSLTVMPWYFLIPVLLLYAMLISTPVLTITLLAWLAQYFQTWVCGSDGMCSETWQVDLLQGLNSVTCALFIGSLCYCLFNFIAEIVMSSIDTVFFCIAIEYDNNVFQPRFKNKVYELLREDCPNQSTPMDRGLPLFVESDVTTTVTGTPQLVSSSDDDIRPIPSAPFAPPPSSVPGEGFGVSSPAPGEQAMIGRSIRYV
ncbi:hypothetical protein FOL47_004291 [Perkinsus chesapeaki]|uniref:Choline transporter-like protein n=1 Tax=Perkinsus chesapeaki TaxID=330153 RepID=A0A7J6M3D4_PERCH|nr:hypothetical protein FOL47_004291 [Perkinsus chesapeaki]